MENLIFAVLTMLIAGFLFYKFVKMRMKDMKKKYTIFEWFVNLCGLGCFVVVIVLIIYIIKNYIL